MMNNLNSVILEGNLVRNPELRETPRGSVLCQFTIGTNRYYKNSQGANQNEVSFIEVEVWRKLAEQCHEFLKKGRGVRVVGRLKQDRWSDNEGKKQSRMKIVGEHVEFKPVKKEVGDLAKELEEENLAF